MTNSDRERRFSTIPCSARTSSPALEVSQAAVVATLGVIEELPQEATGALVFQSEEQECGAVLVEAGRVCWAASNAMSRRLTDILRHQTDPPIETREIERVYLRCRADGTPLGETLVNTGIVTDHGLKSALRQHSAEAVALLGAQAAKRTWKPHAKQRYDARYTFSTADLLVSIGALHSEDLAVQARNRLRHVVDGTSIAVAYLRGKGSALIPIGAAGADWVAASLLIELGNWASTLLDLSTAFTPGQGQITATYSTGASALAWVEDGIIYASLNEDRNSHARLITRVRRDS